MIIDNIQFHKADGGKDFVGIKFKGNKVEIHYPEGFLWSEKILNDLTIIPTDMESKDRSKVQSILRSISFAKTYSRMSSPVFDEHVTKEEFDLEAYHWIISDYKSNGCPRYFNQAIKKNQNGKYHWKKTLQQVPFISENGTFFQNYYVEKKEESETILLKIYQHCVQKSIYFIGWLEGIRYNPFHFNEISEIELDNSTRNRYEYAIRFELQNTYNDKRRLRLQNMLRIITGLNTPVEGELSYGVDSYHYVFEKMIDFVYGNVDPSEYNPRGEWHLTGEPKPKSSNPLMLDSIYIYHKDCLIIDAKCYRYAFEGYKKNSTKGLPATESIQKQLTYGDSVQRHLEEKEHPNVKYEVYNCFILPADPGTVNRYFEETEGNDVGIKVTYAGVYAKGKWRKNNRQPYESIQVYFVDMTALICHFKDVNKADCQEKLLREVKKLLKAEEIKEYHSETHI